MSIGYYRKGQRVWVMVDPPYADEIADEVGENEEGYNENQ